MGIGMGTRQTGGRGAWRANAILTGMLVIAILVVGNRIARGHLAFKRDLSEDQLFAPSEVGLRLVRELDDLVQVRAFFTGDVQSGVVQIAKRRLIDQLEEYVGAANGRINLVYVDPGASSEAMAEANSLGIPGVPIQRLSGTSVTTQNVWLGIVLRYRGRELVLPWVLPQVFEYAFLGAIHKLVRDDDVTVGFLVHGGQGAADEFADVRSLLVEQYRLREVLDLELGDAVPDDVSVLVVARPIQLHARAVFAIDQFIQRGGRVLFLVDRVLVDLRQGRVAPVETGLDRAFEAWGISVEEELVWDLERCNRIPVEEQLPTTGGSKSTGRKVMQPFPLWPLVDKEGLDDETPITAQIRKTDLFWAHPIGTAGSGGVVEGLERLELMHSSQTSWKVDASAAAILDPGAIRSRTTELLASGETSQSALMVALSGRFPSPFADGAPEVFDPIEETLHADRVERALAAGDEPPEREVRTTDEPVLNRATPSQIVVIGDADWATSTNNGKFLTVDNQLLFVSLIDWLALADDLIALRSRVPIERRIDGFLEIERRARGLVGPRTELDDGEARRIARIETEAETAADERRWKSMFAATGGALGLTLLLGFAWKLALGGTPRRTGGAA